MPVELCQWQSLLSEESFPLTHTIESLFTMNHVILEGTLSSAPRESTLPSGTVVVNWEVTTSVAGKAQSVPVQWDQLTKALRRIQKGDSVVVTGSVRRRFFRAGAATASRTEVRGQRFAKSESAAATRVVDSLIGALGD